MRWQTSRRSTNVEDRRGMGAGGGMKIGGVGLLVLMLLAWLGGADPLELLTQVSQSPASGPAAQGGPPPAGDAQSDFVQAVLGDTEDVWTQLFAQSNRRYAQPTLVLFTDAVDSTCGLSSAASGPFYCPPDQKVYIDLGFFRQLEDRFAAPGDFAQAYVIAHEVGHHVQNLLGTSERVHSMRSRASQEQANALSVRQELQADCFAGVWGHHANQQRKLLEEGDVEEGLNAAAAIGDDRMQREARGRVSPESFTHGTSEQRVRWFKRGLDQGSMQQCDTFGSS